MMTHLEFTNYTSLEWENNTSNGTWIEGPAEYNWPVLCLFTIVIAAMGGNILVCLSVKLDKKLQNMFNYFLVSLAMSDMLCAILVMPLSIIRAFLANLKVPSMLCIAWYSLDVLFTSSTIIHLCMISVDRFMALKYPLKYGHAKKRKHTVLKIFTVWLLSFCIAGPLFLFSMFDTQKEVNYKGCGPETTTFVISATVASFYLPLGIMFIMYILTVKALHDQRIHQKKLTNHQPLQYTNSTRLSTSSGNTVTYNWRTPSSDPPRRSTTRHLSVQGAGDKSDSEAQDSCALLRPENGHQFLQPRPSMESRGGTSRLTDDSSNYEINCMTASSTHTDLATSEADYGDRDRNGSRSSSIRRFKLGTLRISVSPRSSRKNSQEKSRKAVQVLGVLFAVFVICYLPFFLTYVINATCLSCRQYIPDQMLTGFEWLAYSGSMINPIVYHIFNQDFRKSMDKLLRCDYKF